jgi:cation/acetate symporter
MIAQFVGAGALLRGLLGIDYEWSVLIVGVLMGTIVLAGGMLAATRIQVIKTFFLLAVTALLIILVLDKVGWNPFDAFDAATAKYGAQATKPSRPPDATAKIDALSLSLALALGTAGLPHIMIRFLTVPSVRAARRSALIACATMSAYLAGIAVIGYGAAVLVGRDAIAGANEAGTTAVPMLARVVGSELIEGIVAGITFAIIVAVLAGLVIAASGALAHDLFTTVMRRGAVDRRRQLAVARYGGAAVCVVAIVLALGAREINLAFLGVLAFSVGAATNLPAMIFGLYWKRFNATGAMAGMGVGLGLSIVLLVLGPNVLGDDAPFPLAQPGIVTIPAGFLAAVAGTIVGARREARTRAPVPEPEARPVGEVA